MIKRTLPGWLASIFQQPPRTKVCDDTDLAHLIQVLSRTGSTTVNSPDTMVIPSMNKEDILQNRFARANLNKDHQPAEIIADHQSLKLSEDD